MLALLLLCGHIMAQTRRISGKVTDEQGSPIPNSSIVIKGTNTGTTSDLNGNFTLTVPASARALVVSSIGMSEKEIALTAESTYNVSLSFTKGDLQEVVVVG